MEELPVPGPETGWLWDRVAAVDSQQVLLTARRQEGETRSFLYDGERLFENNPAQGVDSGLWITRAGSIWLDSSDGLHRFEDGRWVLRQQALVEADRTGVATSSSRALLVRGSCTEPINIRGLDSTIGTRTDLFSTWRARATTNLLSADMSADGLAIFVYETGDVRLYQDREWSSVDLAPARRDGVNFVHIGEGGDLWVASPRGHHLFRTSLGRWGRVRRPFPDPRNRVHAILMDGDVMWMGTAGGVNVHNRPAGSEWRTEILGQDVSQVTGLAQDQAGGIWVTSGNSFEGALHWNGTDWSGSFHAGGRTSPARSGRSRARG